MLGRAGMCWLVAEPTDAPWTHIAFPVCLVTNSDPWVRSVVRCRNALWRPLICTTGAAGAAGPGAAWQQVSAGEGAKGHRYYDWVFLRLDHDRPALGEQAGKHWLMIRRNQRTGELVYYQLLHAPTSAAGRARPGGRQPLED
jgi:hypothetical protein